MSSRQEDLRYRLKCIDEEVEDTAYEMPSSRNNPRRPFSSLFISSVCGLVFGFALEKGRVFEPHIIREQMLFENFTMLKMFLSATGTGALVFSVLTMVTPRTMDDVVNSNLIFLTNKTAKGVMLGAAMLGSGMTLAGACPGMVLAQFGASVPNSGLVLVGGLLGVLAYALTDQVLPLSLRSRRKIEHTTLDEVLCTPYMSLGLPFAAMLGIGVAGVEMVFPWITQVEQSGSGLFGSRAWPPYVAGALIGSLQAPVVLSVGDTLGSSSSYTTIVSQSLLFRSLRRSLAYLRPYETGLENWWQVFYVAGAVLGANLSARMSDTLGTVSGVSPMAALGGGFLMLYGSRMAGGCTSGHGLSGMGLLIVLSFVAVPAMFSGGIATAVLMKYGLGSDM